MALQQRPSNDGTMLMSRPRRWLLSDNSDCNVDYIRSKYHFVLGVQSRRANGASISALVKMLNKQNYYELYALVKWLHTIAICIHVC